MKIESTKVTVLVGKDEVIRFLKDAQNIIYLLPRDQISDWKATSDECSFKVQGGVVISLVQAGSDDQSIVSLKSGEKSPFPFSLTIHLSGADSKTEGYLAFDGEVNVFLKMMVEKPLTALFNMMSENLKRHFEQ